ncbi:hypothetical protein CDD82_1383 [Ophiocordyceps australis]|uniref:Uncharacterized protein n=1 Tax=Ophiocordyceps australis TaxID=1399860 RepID=A0A2C5ZMI3_9HYPO|nr:hypothetical protein CDD82_1383 [Ophiocordyceps australis]
MVGQIWAAIANFGEIRRRGETTEITPKETSRLIARRPVLPWPTGLRRSRRKTESKKSYFLSGDEESEDEESEDEENENEDDEDDTLTGKGKEPEGADTNVIEKRPEGVGSSSSNESEVPSVVMDEKAHKSCCPPELATANVAKSVIQHVLLFAGEQKEAALQEALEYRVPSIKMDRHYGAQHFRAEDDGGICYRKRHPKEGLQIIDNHIAILEAKREVTAFVDGRPHISDRCLGQMTCEAILMRSEKTRALPGNSVVIIHAAQTYLRFFEFEISEQYIKEFPRPSRNSFINVYSTGWLDLNELAGREAIVANLSALMKAVRKT